MLLMSLSALLLVTNQSTSWLSATFDQKTEAIRLSRMPKDALWPLFLSLLAREQALLITCESHYTELAEILSGKKIGQSTVENLVFLNL